MKISGIMNRNIKTIEKDSSVWTAAKLMRDGDFGALPVVDGTRVIGMITDRDITVRYVAQEMDIDSRVQEIMTPEAVTCFESDDINQVAFVMGDRQIRRIVVLDSERRISGIVSLADIAKHASTAQKAETVLSEISQPTHNEPGSVRLNRPSERSDRRLE
jgi:CBS domain-containing protein